MGPIRTLAPDDGEDVDAFAERCEGGHSHVPTPRYLELHHVVPQSWQKSWHPGDTEYKNNIYTKIFDPRTVALCRTSHGNVHFWLSAFMHYIAANETDETPTDLDNVVHQVLAGQHDRHRAEVEIARQALLRWHEAGGNLRALTRIGMFGGIYGS